MQLQKEDALWSAEPDVGSRFPLPFNSTCPGRKSREDPTALMLDECREFQSQPGSIPDCHCRMMVTNDLNPCGAIRLAIAMPKDKIVRLPFRRELDLLGYMAIMIS